MGMADRPDVEVASLPLAFTATAGLVANVGWALAGLPFRQPFAGPDSALRNLGMNVVRETVRSFMGYAVTLRVPEMRAVEWALDRACQVVMPPLVARQQVIADEAEVGGVPGTWYRRRDGERIGTMLYLHGGGYLATTPQMYAFFTSALASTTACDTFVPDYRLAPEFPFPAPLEDVLAVYEGILADGCAPDELIVAGDSGGGGLVTSLIELLATTDRPEPFGLLLLSPQVDLELADPSVVQNADRDILPREVPVTPYLQGAKDPRDAIVSAVNADPEHFPRMIVVTGGDEMFHDAIVRFAEGVEEAGVRVDLIDEPDMFHVYMVLVPWMSASRRLNAAIADLFQTYRRMGRLGQLDPETTRELEERHRLTTKFRQRRT
jgi:acetyl esterase/lipase